MEKNENMSNLNKNMLFILAILCILVIIPSSFASDVNDNSTLADGVVADSNSIYVDIEAGDDGVGSQESPYNDLSKAIDSFDSTVNSNIYVKNGTYVFDGQVIINKAVTIVGESRDGVIFDGKNASGLFSVSANNVQFNSLSFVNGLGKTSWSGGYAGAIDSSGRLLVIDNCIFKNNTAGAISAGGGSEWNPAEIQVKNCEFINNSKVGWGCEGGAVQVAGIYSYLNMTNCLFINNTATQGGGAVSINNGRKESFITNCEFISNAADYGSAIYFSNAYDATITDCKFSDNIAGNDSGVIDFTGSYYQRKLSVKNNVFENNIPDKSYNVDEKIEIVDLGNNDRLSGEDVVMDSGDDKNFTVTLTDSEGNPIVSKLITVTLTDFLKKVTVFEGITNENGQAVFSLINQTAGTYTVVSNFAGDSTWDNVSAINQIKIKADHSNNIVFNESIVKVKAGESYLVQGYVMDEYLSYVVQAFSLYDISWETHSGGKSYSTNHNINNGKFVVDVLDFDLSTQSQYYYINFTSTNENGNVAYGTLIVDTSIPLPPVNESADIIYVAKDGSDEFGDGSEENPLATPQVALYVNEIFGGNKVIFVKEGTYDISNYEIYANVTVVGEKGKTVFRQHTGDEGMLWLDNGATTDFINMTFIDGYRSPYTLMGGSVIVVRYSGSIAHFTGCEFYNNSGSSDGMMYVANGGIAYIDDCIFKNNSGKTFNPAGAVLVLDGYLSVNNSYFADNFGAEGGAIFVGGDSVAFIENTVFYNNTAYNDSAALAGGGAIYVNNWNTHIYNCSFIENYAEVNGGAIYILTGKVEIEKSLFENNRVIPGNGKGSTIASDSGYPVLLYVSDSILFSDDYSKLISITGTYENDIENEIILNDNHWANSYQTGVREYAVIEFTASEENVTEGDLVIITVKFAPNTGGEYERSLHDYALNISTALGDVDKESIVIADNVVQFKYYATKEGDEVITFTHGSNTYRFNFEVSADESDRNDFDANISVDEDKTNIIVEVPDDILNNITVILDGVEKSVSADGSKVTLPINVLPGNHTVRVAYSGDSNYKSYLSDTFKFNVDKFRADLNIYVNSGVMGDDFIAQITANDYLTGDVIVTVNGRNYTVKVTNGTGSVPLKDLAPDEYVAYATFRGNDYVNEGNSSTSFIITQFEIDVIYVSADGNDTTGDGSIGSPYASISRALDRNKRLGGNKTIIVNEGNYVLNRYAVTDNVTIKSDGTVVISASNANHLFIGGKVSVTLDGLTFINGNGLDAGSIEMGSDDAGNIGKELLIVNCDFVNNTGAVGAIKSYAKTTIVESTFVNNTATGNSGSNQAIISVSDNEALINTSIFLNNHYGKYVVVSTSSVSANTNFWGTNDKTRDVLDNVIINTWVSAIPGIADDVRTKTNYDLTVEFLETADGASFNAIDGNMPDLTVDLTSKIGLINQTQAVISNNVATVNYNVSFKGNELLTVDLNGIRLSNLAFHVDVPEYDKIYVSGNGNDSAEGSKDSPVLTIQHALDVNKAGGGNKTIVLLPGVYKEHGLIIDDVVTIIGENATINGENNELFAISADAEIHNLTLTNAKLAINHKSGDLKINGLQFTNCENAIKSSSKLTVDNSTFTENTGIVIDATDLVSIMDSKFNQNDASSVIRSTKELSLLNSTFNNNNVNDGAVNVKGNASIISNEFNSNRVAIISDGAEGVIDSNNFNNDEIALKSSDFDVTSNLNTKINLEDSKISNVVVTFLEGSTVFADKGTIQLNATVTDSMGNLINGGKVTFTDNGNSIGDANVENGKAIISKEFIKGNHTISGSFDSDNDAEIIDALLRVDVDYYWFIGDDKYETLAQAVEAAEWGDVIKGIPGTYYISKQPIGHRYFSLEPWEVLKSVTITSLGDSPVILSGDSNQMFFVDIGSELTLKNVVVANAGSLREDGGAIETMYDTNLTMINCTFENNTAENGGAVYAGGNLVLKDSVFNNNSAGLAGALEVAYLYYTTGTISIDNVTFTNNRAVYAGALYLGSSDVDLDNVKFINNTANVAGALFVRGGTTRVSNAEFISNSVTSDDSATTVSRGGAVHNMLGDLYFENTKFINNSATGIGGALELENGLYGTISWTTFDNCEFINNSASEGGAMYLGETYDPYVRITSSVFDSNTAENNGAAIYDNCAHVTVENAEFINNRAVSGFDIIHATGEFVSGEGFSPDQTFPAELTIENSVFRNTTSDYVIFANAYGIVDIRNTTFDNQNMIIFNRGDATFIKNTVTNSKDDVIDNEGNLSLDSNAFDTPITNNNVIKTVTYIVILDNETKSAAIGDEYELTAKITDDNGNVIRPDNLTFVVDNVDIAAKVIGCEFRANYTVTNGTHFVTAKSDDKGLDYLKLKTGILIGKESVDVSVNVESAVVGGNATIIIELDSKASGNVTVKVNNKTYEMPIENGKAVFNISDLSAGNYPMEIIYSGDDTYAPNEVSTILNVSKVSDYPFDVEITKNSENKSAAINVVLPSDVNGNVSVKVAGTDYIVPVKYGKASLVISDLTTGTYDVDVVFDGSDKYSNSTKHTSFKTDKLDSFVIVKVDSVVVGNDVIVDLTLPSDATGDIIISFADKEYLTSIDAGKSSYVLSGLNVGNYNISVIYNGDSNYKDSVNSTSFNVLNVPIVGTEIVFTGFGDNMLSGVIRDVNGNALSNANLSYVAGSLEGNVLSDNDGVFAIPVSSNSLAVVSFEGNDAYDASNASFKLGKLTNDRLPTQFNIANGYVFETYAVDYYSGERGKTFTFQLNDVNGNPLSNKTIYIGYNGVTYNRTTNETGHASLQINLKDKNKVTFAIAFLGDDGYNANMSVCVVHVKQKTTSITAAAKTFKATAKTKKYTATLKSILGASVDGKTYIPVGKKVTMKINGKTYTGKIAKNGKVTFSLKITKKGKYTAVINYAGDTTYKASTKKVKITIN